MKLHYLEIVTSDIDGTCALYSDTHSVTFGDVDPDLGGARTAEMATGGMLGVRSPLRDDEAPVVRPYFRVNDIESAVNAAAKSNATIALPPTEIPNHGTCAIFIHNGTETGLWQT
jgi:predicted enzyme related to lactoylglutathione lyase